MSTSVLYMSMSLDGLSLDPTTTSVMGLGLGGERLHHWLAEGGDGVGGYDRSRRDLRT